MGRTQVFFDMTANGKAIGRIIMEVIFKLMLRVFFANCFMSMCWCFFLCSLEVMLCPKLQVGLCNWGLMKLYSDFTLQKTSGLFALGRKDLVTRALLFIVWFLALCAKEVISQREMVLEESLSMVKSEYNKASIIQHWHIQVYLMYST